MSVRRSFFFSIVGLALLAGCRGEVGGPPSESAVAQRPHSSRVDEPQTAEKKPKPATSAPPTKAPPATLPTRFGPAPRIVAFGDVHGDLEATRAALRLGGAIDEQDRWIGGPLVVVQTGDQLDRGDDEQAIVDLFVRLAREAEAAGGAFHALNGNHELMNALGDFRYVTPGGYQDFEDVEGLDRSDPRLAQLPVAARARAAAMLPGGPYARIFAARNTVVIVGDTVFAHGGVLPAYARKLDQINEDIRQWLRGEVDPATVIPEMMDPKGVVWAREYSRETGPTQCAALAETLRQLSATRMVVGHTPQMSGITSACDDKVWRVDVGMAAHYGGSVQVLEIKGGEVRVLSP